MDDRLERGQRVKAVRKHFKDSQAAFARRLSDLSDGPPLTQGAVYQWEHGGGLSDESRELFKAIGVSMTYLLDGQGPMFRKAGAIADYSKQRLHNPTEAGLIDNPTIKGYKLLWHGTHGTLMDEGEPFAMLQRPASLGDTTEAYALVTFPVKDHESGLRSGATIVVLKDAEPRDGDWAVIHADGQIYLAREVKVTDKSVGFLHALNGQKDSIPKKLVENIERVKSIEP